MERDLHQGDNRVVGGESPVRMSITRMNGLARIGPQGQLGEVRLLTQGLRGRRRRMRLAPNSTLMSGHGGKPKVSPRWIGPQSCVLPSSVASGYARDAEAQPEKRRAWA